MGKCIEGVEQEVVDRAGKREARDIASIYGMNFRYMPELGWKYGYPFALGMMVVVALALIAWLKRKRWVVTGTAKLRAGGLLRGVRPRLSLAS